MTQATSVAPARPAGRLTRAVTVLRAQPALALGTLVLLAVGATALLAPLLSGDPNAVDPPVRLSGPSAEHLFGTDNLGREVLARTLHGGRMSLGVGVLVVLFAVGGGTLVGLATGFYRWADLVGMRVVDGLMAFPGLVMAIALIGVLGPGLGTVVTALSLVYAPRVARIVRGSVLVAKELPMVEAVRSLGATNAHVLFRHILPTCLSPIIVQATFVFSYAILGEAALSFLGVGIPAQTPTWGNVLTEARSYLQQAWWMAVFPGLFIVVTVLSLNLVGDALRDLLDPKLRGR